MLYPEREISADIVFTSQETVQTCEHDSSVDSDLVLFIAILKLTAWHFYQLDIDNLSEFENAQRFLSVSYDTFYKESMPFQPCYFKQ